MDRTVATEDEPPVVLGQLPAEFAQAMGPRLTPGALVRFSIMEGVRAVARFFRFIVH